MSGQRDVDIPPCLRPRLGSLLAGFEAFLHGRVIAQWRVDKEPGGHVTSWWIYCQLSSAAPSSSVVVFGETDFAEVNATPHLWVRGKAKWIDAGYKLLVEYMAAERVVAELPPKPKRPPPPPTLSTRAPFLGGEYGEEYLSFEANMEILPAAAPVGVEAEGWHFGILVSSGAKGWYPPTFVH